MFSYFLRNQVYLIMKYLLIYYLFSILLITQIELLPLPTEPETKNNFTFTMHTTLHHFVNNQIKFQIKQSNITGHLIPEQINEGAAGENREGKSLEQERSFYSNFQNAAGNFFNIINRFVTYVSGGATPMKFKQGQVFIVDNINDKNYTHQIPPLVHSSSTNLESDYKLTDLDLRMLLTGNGSEMLIVSNVFKEPSKYFLPPPVEGNETKFKFQSTGVTTVDKLNDSNNTDNEKKLSTPSTLLTTQLLPPLKEMEEESFRVASDKTENWNQSEIFSPHLLLPLFEHNNNNNNGLPISQQQFLPSTENNATNFNRVKLIESRIGQSVDQSGDSNIKISGLTEIPNVNFKSFTQNEQTSTELSRFESLPIKNSQTFSSSNEKSSSESIKLSGFTQLPSQNLESTRTFDQNEHTSTQLTSFETLPIKNSQTFFSSNEKSNSESIFGLTQLPSQNFKSFFTQNLETFDQNKQTSFETLPIRNAQPFSLTNEKLVESNLKSFPTFEHNDQKSIELSKFETLPSNEKLIESRFSENFKHSEQKSSTFETLPIKNAESFDSNKFAYVLEHQPTAVDRGDSSENSPTLNIALPLDEIGSKFSHLLLQIHGKVKEPANDSMADNFFKILYNFTLPIKFGKKLDFNQNHDSLEPEIAGNNGFYPPKLENGSEYKSIKEIPLVGHGFYNENPSSFHDSYGDKVKMFKWK